MKLENYPQYLKKYNGGQAMKRTYRFVLKTASVILILVMLFQWFRTAPCPTIGLSDYRTSKITENRIRAEHGLQKRTAYFAQ